MSCIQDRRDAVLSVSDLLCCFVASSDWECGEWSGDRVEVSAIDAKAKHELRPMHVRLVGL
jgi:hypothetical protein